jgi:DNA sulfur modification protein DndD
MQKPVYNKYLCQRAHHSSEKYFPAKTSVSVEFKYAQSGRVDTYLVKRFWTYDDAEIDEHLEVYQNGARLQDIDEELWQDFLMDLIPLGVSNLFFFDGEKIQNLAEEETDNRYLIRSLHSLLGLDLVERLQTDLRIYLLRKAKEEDKQLEIELLTYEKKKKVLEEHLDTILQRRAQVQTQMDCIQSEIEAQEHQIAKEGGGFANKREELRALRKKLEEEIESTKGNIRNLCSDLLPFALVPDLCISLRDRLVKEEKYEQEKAAVAALDSIMEDFIKQVRSEHFWDEFDFVVAHKEEVAKKIAETLKKIIAPAQNSSVQIIHHLSSRERDKLIEWIEKAVNSIPSDLRLLTSNLEKLVRQRQEVDNSLFKAPMDDVLHPFIKKLSSLHEELGVLQENYRNLEEDLRKTQYELSQVNSQIEKKIEQKTQLQKLSERSALAKKVQSVLQEYIIRLRREKIKNLCESFLECFKWLSNKQHLVERIDINPDDFSINLWSGDGQIIPKNQLSAGEKQIYAVAMLWALARTSGRPLPFMIDTPLGRLDASHRENIVQYFFPHASHQVIVFSTDTEIDQQYFEKLQPYISKAYHLEYDEDVEATRVSVGYFWKRRKEEDITR